MKILMLHSPFMELRDQDGMLNLFKVNKHRLQKVIILDLLPNRRLEWIARSIDGKLCKMLVAVDHRQLTQEELLCQIKDQIQTKNKPDNRPKSSLSRRKSNTSRSRGRKNVDLSPSVGSNLGKYA